MTKPRRGIRVYVTPKSLNKIEVEGSGDVRVDDVDGEKFSVAIRGSGDVRVVGHANSVELSVAGSGDIDASNLHAREGIVHISGSGDIKVHASKSLDANVSGSGDIRYGGNPEKISKSIAGSGSVRKM